MSKKSLDTLVFSSEPSGDWLAVKSGQFFSEKAGTPKNTKEILLLARASSSSSGPGEIVGGLQGNISFGGAYISLVAVRKDWRKSYGVGKSLIARFFEVARKSAPHPASVGYLATFDFQAIDYYPKIGFSLDCKLPGWAHGITAAFFSKTLTTPIASSAQSQSQLFTIEEVESADDSGNKTAGALELDQFISATIAEQEIEVIGHDSKFFFFTSEASVSEGSSTVTPVGGISCFSFWGGLIIDQIAVSESYQRNGIGRRLVESALSKGREQGCTVATVDVFSFYDLTFWHVLGFKEFGRVSGFLKDTELIRLYLSLI